MICPTCNTDGAYVGLMVVECASENCSHFSIKAPGYKAKVISTPELTQFGRKRHFRFEIEIDGIESFPIKRGEDVLKYADPNAN